MNTKAPLHRELLQAAQLRASANRAALARRQADARAAASAEAKNKGKEGR